MKKLILTLFVFVLSLPMLAEVSEKEKNALVDLYMATNGEKWNSTWDINKNVGNWHGVTVTNGHVTSISLLFNNLEGQIPSSIGDLTFLEKLELSFNNIHGTLPSSLGNIVNLRVFAINGNNLEGKIPASMGNLTNLEQLHLSSNAFHGEVPKTIGQLDKLQVLNIFDNNLEGTLPAELAISKNLKKLVIAENNIKNTESFASILLFEAEEEKSIFKKPTAVPAAKSIIAIETSDDDEN